jgi:hypothetical protein
LLGDVGDRHRDAGDYHRGAGFLVGYARDRHRGAGFLVGYAGDRLRGAGFLVGYARDRHRGAGLLVGCLRDRHRDAGPLVGCLRDRHGHPGLPFGNNKECLRFRICDLGCVQTNPPRLLRSHPSQEGTTGRPLKELSIMLLEIPSPGGEAPTNEGGRLWEADTN